MNSEHLHPEGRPYTKEEFVEKIKTDKKFSERFGDLGRIYGAQWRKWRNPSICKISKEFSDIWDGRTHTEIDCPIDQISELITQLKENPDSRRLMVNAWAVHDLPNMVLPPCHYGFQVYTRELSRQERSEYYYKHGNSEGIVEGSLDRPIWKDDETAHKWYNERSVPTRAISLMWNQRSCDLFLGIPFNIASYGLLLEIIAKEVNMVPDELIGNLGDVHLYSNHIEQAKEQIGKELTLDERNTLLYTKIGGNHKRENCFSDEEFERETLTDCKAFNIPTRTREPFPLPKLKLGHFGSILENVSIVDLSDFILENYQSHPTIKAPLSN
jgi:thymidylate synthase